MKKIKDIDKIRYFIDDDGVVVGELREGETVAILQTGDRILRKNNIESYDNQVAIKMRFGKVNLRVFGKIAAKYPLFLLMLDYVAYQSGKLMFKNGVTINRRNLAKACGVSNATVDRQLKGLIEEDVIKSVKDGRDSVFFVNPYVFHIGKKVNYSLYELFKDTAYRENYERRLDSDDI